MSDAPLIYVDLIEDEPMTLDEFTVDGHAPDGVTRTEQRGAGTFTVTSATYREYLDNFQPWRVLIISGGNHEPLFRSTEAYFNEADAKHAVDLAFGPGSNVYLRQSETGNVALRMAAE